MAAENATTKSESKENQKCGEVTGFGDTGGGAIFHGLKRLSKCKGNLAKDVCLKEAWVRITSHPEKVASQ